MVESLAVIYCNCLILKITPCSKVSIVNFEHVIADWELFQKSWQNTVGDINRSVNIGKKKIFLLVRGRVLFISC